MPEFQWSQTPASNTTADPNINWREGMAPALVNDSARAMMAELAKKRDDDAGLLVTGGTSTAYTLSTNQNLNSVTSPANVNGFKVSFQFHAANGAAATLSVDSQTAAPLQLADGTALPSGFYGTNEIVDAVYKASIPAWIVHGGSLLSKTNTWSGAQTFNGANVSALSGATPYTIRRTENDTTLRKIFSGQSGSGAGDDYSINETGDGSNNVATVTEQIGSTVIGAKTKTGYGFAIPVDMTEIATPANPASGVCRFYSKSGLAALYAKEGTAGSEHLVGPLALAGARGLVIANNAGTPNTQVDITVSEAILTDSNGIGVYYSGGTLTANCAGTGANGLDTSTLANSTWYFLYLIYNPATNTFASLASTSSTTPTMPSGYTAKMRVGAIVTDASAHFMRIVQRGKRAVYNLVAASNTIVFPNISGSTGSVTTSKSTAAFCPSTATSIIVTAEANAVTSTIAAAGGNALLTQTSSGQVAAVMAEGGAFGMSVLAEINFETAATIWVNNSAAGSAKVNAYGWVDAVNAV